MKPHSRPLCAMGFLISLLLANPLFAPPAFGRNAVGAVEEENLPAPAENTGQATPTTAPVTNAVAAQARSQNTGTEPRKEGKSWKKVLLALGAGAATIAIVALTTRGSDDRPIIVDPPTIVVGEPTVGQP